MCSCVQCFDMCVWSLVVFPCCAGTALTSTVLRVYVAYHDANKSTRQSFFDCIMTGHCSQGAWFTSPG